ncbi:LytR/AlgR family response regulator transcription factor [Paenibacillus sp. GCM10012306]|uniref:LytR/AlgR family response regulator transcription factor n=1 Tax=Paenibacillus sp. GCM10012306 TaxID=3317342 RepID=UPI00360E6913
MFHLAICSEETEIHSLFTAYLDQLSYNTSFTFKITSFLGGEELIQTYKERQEYLFDILIIDIEMKDVSGIDVANIIRRIPDRNVHIIFLADHEGYMRESLEVLACQYFLKPVTYALFETKMIKLCKYILLCIHPALMLKTESKQIVLRNSDIIAILKIKHSLVQNKLNVITEQETHLISGTLLEYANQLTFPFIPIHRSIIVNMEHIRQFNSNFVLMSNGESYTVGRTHTKDFKRAYNTYFNYPH